MNTDFSYCKGTENNKCKNCKRYITLYDERFISDILWFVEPKEKNCENFINIK